MMHLFIDILRNSILITGLVVVMMMMLVVMMFVHRKSSLQVYFISNIISIESPSVKSFLFHKRTPRGAFAKVFDSV